MRILLVEDEAEHAFPLIEFLEREGHTVRHTIHRDGALKLLDNEEFDVAAVDLALVASMGHTVAEYACKKGVGVVIMSAADDVAWEDLNASMELKGCYIACKLRKPITPQMLLVALNMAAKSPPTSWEGT